MSEKDILYRKSVDLLKAGFGFNESQAVHWLIMPNPHLGGVAPATLIVRGRGHKVVQFIEAAIELTRPPVKD